MRQLNRLFALCAIALCSLCLQPALAQDAGLLPDQPKLPLSNTPSAAYAPPQLTFAQQQARFSAQQRLLRMEFNNWIGHSPLRPNMNASYMSNGFQRYYIPPRSMIVSTGNVSTWYW